MNPELAAVAILSFLAGALVALAFVYVWMMK